MADFLALKSHLIQVSTVSGFAVNTHQNCSIFFFSRQNDFSYHHIKSIIYIQIACSEKEKIFLIIASIWQSKLLISGSAHFLIFLNRYIKYRMGKSTAIKTSSNTGSALYENQLLFFTYENLINGKFTCLRSLFLLWYQLYFQSDRIPVTYSGGFTQLQWQLLGNQNPRAGLKKQRYPKPFLLCDCFQYSSENFVAH